MMKRVLVQVGEGTHAAWKARAFSEGRSMSELARDLIERAVLTERGAGSEGSDPGTPGVRLRGTAVPSPPRSVSADAAATVPVVAKAHMRGDRPSLECSERLLPGTQCSKCGRTV